MGDNRQKEKSRLKEALEKFRKKKHRVGVARQRSMKIRNVEEVTGNYEGVADFTI